MKHNNHTRYSINIRSLYYMAITALLLSGCIGRKDVNYLQGTNIYTDYKTPTVPYKIQTNDELYVKIESTNAELSEVFGKQAGSSGGGGSRYNNVYLVSSSGEIEAPQIGSVVVNGLTVEEVQKLLQRKIDSIYNESSVVVRLAEFNFTILGEINGAGRYTTYNNKLSIFEAIGQAGDLTIYGSRKNIDLIRRKGDTHTIYNIDLTQPELLTSENYYIQPNDIIYVRPLKESYYSTRNVTILPYTSVVLSVVSITVLLFTTFRK